MAEAATGWRRTVERHPRLWGALFAGLLLAGYVGVLRPARIWAAEHVAYPMFRAIDTPRSQGFRVARTADRPDAVWAVPRALLAEGGVEDAIATQRGQVAEWAVPVGVLFVLPAMLLVGVYPTRRYWLGLLAYHVAVGVVAFGLFAVGLAYVEPAFALYTFSRTYLTESVSLTVPLLLLLAGGAFGGGLAPADTNRQSEEGEESSPPVPNP